AGTNFPGSSKAELIEKIEKAKEISEERQGWVRSLAV
ncbi:MAG: hypothetical protein G01um1014107_352, partial [Parcubacteria group bacterium Gr01-1014_107]